MPQPVATAARQALSGVEVPWHGLKDAPVLVVGEAPGVQEARERRPFVGESGRLMRAEFERAGLDPEHDVRWGNAYPSLPDTPGGKFWTGKERALRLAGAAGWRARELAGSRHSLVLLTGSVALQALSSGLWTSVEDVAGAWLSLDTGWEMRQALGESAPTPLVGALRHPASVLRDPLQSYRGALMVWLSRYLRGLECRDPKLESVCFRPLTDDADLRLGEPLVFDTEYTLHCRSCRLRLDPDKLPELCPACAKPVHASELRHVPWVVGIAALERPDVVYQAGTLNGMTVADIQRVRLLLGSAQQVIAHNLPADLRALDEIRITLPDRVALYDTMQAGAILQPDLDKNLSEMVRFWCAGVQPWKQLAGEHGLLYNAFDVMWTARLARAQQLELAADPVLTRLVARQHTIIERIESMSREGMCVDRERYEHLRRHHARWITRLTGYVRRLVEPETTPVAAAIAESAVRVVAGLRSAEEVLREEWAATRTCACATRLRSRSKKCDDCARAWDGFLAARVEIRKKRDAAARYRATAERRHTLDPDNDFDIRWLMFTVWALKPLRRYRTPTGLPQVDVRALEEYMSGELTAQQSRVLQLVIRVRQLTKALSTFLTLELDAENHIHPQIKMHGTATGRPSSGGDPDAEDDAAGAWDSFNAFNIPVPYRAIYVPRPGYTFVGGDFSDLEGRLVALLSADKSLLEWYAAGIPPHGMRAHLAFPALVPRPDKKLAKKAIVYATGGYRLDAWFVAKRLGHGGHYGMGVEEAAAQMRMPPNVARPIYERIWKHHAGIRRWQQQVGDLVWGRTDTDPLTGFTRYLSPAARMLRTAFGRRRFYFGRRKEGIKKALAQDPQSLGADIWYTTLGRIAQPRSSLLLPPWDGRVVTGTYDSFLCEILTEQAPEFAHWLATTAAQEITELRALPGARSMRPCFPMEVRIGRSYKEVTE